MKPIIINKDDLGLHAISTIRAAKLTGLGDKDKDVFPIVTT